MKKILLAAAIVVSFTSIAEAQSYNNPYAAAQARQRAAKQGIIGTWAHEALRTRIPSLIIEPRSYQTRRYGTPIGWCKTVRKSDVGKYFGFNPVQICNYR